MVESFISLAAGEEHWSGPLELLVALSPLSGVVLGRDRTCLVDKEVIRHVAHTNSVESKCDGDPEFFFRLLCEQSHQGGDRRDDQSVPDIPFAKVVWVSDNAPQSDVASLIRDAFFVLGDQELLLLQVSCVLPNVGQDCPDKSNNLTWVDLVTFIEANQ